MISFFCDTLQCNLAYWVFLAGYLFDSTLHQQSHHPRPKEIKVESFTLYLQIVWMLLKI